MVRCALCYNFNIARCALYYNLNIAHCALCYNLNITRCALRCNINICTLCDIDIITKRKGGSQKVFVSVDGR